MSRLLNSRLFDMAALCFLLRPTFLLYLIRCLTFFSLRALRSFFHSLPLPFCLLFCLTYDTYTHISTSRLLRPLKTPLFVVYILSRAFSLLTQSGHIATLPQVVYDTPSHSY